MTTAPHTGATGVPRPAHPAQIKTRQRVRDLAEVYTHEREVNAMLDLVPDMFPSEADPNNTDRTFLEPAAGSGNFLVEILRRKIAFLAADRYAEPADYEHRLLRALASIYAIDIDAENVDESKARLRGVLLDHLDADPAAQRPSLGFLSAVDAILETNIALADTLRDLDAIEWVEYRPGRGHTFVRTWSTVEHGGLQDDLFAEEKTDAAPIHYSLVAAHPEPLTAPVKAEVA